MWARAATGKVFFSLAFALDCNQPSDKWKMSGKPWPVGGAEGGLIWKTEFFYGPKKCVGHYSQLMMCYNKRSGQEFNCLPHKLWFEARWWWWWEGKGWKHHVVECLQEFSSSLWHKCQIEMMEWLGLQAALDFLFVAQVEIFFEWLSKLLFFSVYFKTFLESE